MKKYLLFILLSFSFSVYVAGQGLIQLTDTTGTDITNDTLIVSVQDPVEDILSAHVHVTNNSDASINVKIYKFENQIVENTSNTICWAGICFPPDSYETDRAQEIPAGETNTSFHGDYTHNTNSGQSEITYVFFDEAMPDDTAFVLVLFRVNTNDAKELPSVLISNAYPNPANDFVMMDYEIANGVDAFISLHNILGVELERRILKPFENKVKIETGQLKPGIYFYSVFVENSLQHSNKIKIYH